MLSPTPATWSVRGATFALWALAAGSAAFWGLKVSGSARSVAAPVAAPRQVAAADPAAIARLLGSAPAAAGGQAPAAAPALASRFQLLGVAAGTHSGQGAAVISVDGKPPRSYRVGGAIDDGLVLQSVRGRQAVIASQRDGQPVVTLELPRSDGANRVAPAPGTVLPTAPAVAGAPVVAPAVPVAPPNAPVVAPALPAAPAADAQSHDPTEQRARRKRQAEP